MALAFQPMGSSAIRTAISSGSSSIPGAADFSPGWATGRPGIIRRFEDSRSVIAPRRTCSHSSSVRGLISTVPSLVITVWTEKPDDVGGRVDDRMHEFPHCGGRLIIRLSQRGSRSGSRRRLGAPTCADSDQGSSERGEAKPEKSSRPYRSDRHVVTLA